MRKDWKGWRLILLLWVGLPGCAKAVAEDKTVAVVNGTRITEGQWHQALIERAGVLGLQQMIDEMLMEQAARQQGINVSEKDVDDAFTLHRSRATSERDFQEQWQIIGVRTEKEYRAHLKRELLIDRIIAKQAQVSEADLRAYYNQRKNDFVEPEKVQVRDILLSSQQNAQELVKALRNPQSNFAELAKIFSEDPTTKSKGGDRGLERLDDLARPLSDALRKLKPGDVSDPVNNQGEWHILKLEKRLPRRQKSFEEALPEVQQIVAKQKQAQLKQTFMQRLREQAKVQIGDPRLQAAFTPKK
jgi:foldase protein PrsA